MSDKLLIDELISLRSVVSDIMGYVDRDENGLRPLINHTVVMPELETMSRILNKIIVEETTGETND